LHHQNFRLCIRLFYFYLGTCFWAINVAIANRLNGIKRLILGNHDCHRFDLYIRHFQRLFGAHYWKRCILTHVPVHPQQLCGKYLLNVHGHLHSKEVKTGIHYANEEKYLGEMVWVSHLNYFNVSVECHGLKPVNSSIIMDRLEEIGE